MSVNSVFTTQPRRRFPSQTPRGELGNQMALNLNLLWIYRCMADWSSVRAAEIHGNISLFAFRTSLSLLVTARTQGRLSARRQRVRFETPTKDRTRMTFHRL